MELELKDILILFTIAQLFVLSLILFIQKFKGKSGSLFLSAFFISLSLNIFNLFASQHAAFFTDHSIHLYHLGAPFAFAYAPSFFLYVKSITGFKSRISFHPFIHYLPFILHFSYIIISFTLLPESEKRILIFEKSLYSVVQYKLITAILQIQVMSYFISVIFSLHNYRKKIKTILSSIEKANYSWMSFLLIGLLCLWILDLSRYFILYVSEGKQKIIETFLFIGFVIFSYLFIYKALSSPILSIHFPDVNTKKISLSLQSRSKYFNQLELCMQNDKPFLDPDLTLISLSELTRIPPRSLSEVLKICKQQSFYDYVNTYRILEAELLFNQDNENEKTILEVLYAVGFNSKSSFNTAFKKKMGITPTEYRRNCELEKTQIKKSS